MISMDGKVCQIAFQKGFNHIFWTNDEGDMAFTSRSGR